MEAAELSILTHSHSLGYMPSSVVSHIISRILCSHDEMSLKDMVLEARDSVSKLFAEDKNLPVLVDIIDKISFDCLKKTDTDDLDNIHALGEGWVAEETLGIALYCALKYQNDFSKAMIVSVNHKGDSDSTGAVTGNILGALIGYDAIDSKWKKDLELLDVILKLLMIYVMAARCLSTVIILILHGQQNICICIVTRAKEKSGICILLAGQ